ncbi:MAG TPA: purine-nucleoside phosphorylase [Thermoanaerobaculaceae bacterium]|nr:purine-nucleoside phosphorylase [Thermoanaerobaculaceae bacterium]
METLTPRALEDAARTLAGRVRTGRLVGALVAGSGISLGAPGWEKGPETPYSEVFPFPIFELPGHTPTVTVWRRDDLGLLTFNGRFHLYQGYSAAQVAAIPRLAGLLGAPVYVATNASGSLDPAAQPGSLVVVKDHLNFQGTSPLVGEWIRWRAPMFPDLTDAYDPGLRAVALRCARDAGFAVTEGVYVATLGANYETPAEVEAYRRIGGTVVGMSTVQEVIAARQFGMRVLVLSLATNMAAGIAGRPLTHTEVLEAGEAARARLQTLLAGLVAELSSGAA